MIYKEVCKECGIVETCKRKHVMTKDECTWRPRLVTRISPRRDTPQQYIHRMQQQEHAIRLSTIENGGG